MPGDASATLPSAFHRDTLTAESSAIQTLTQNSRERSRERGSGSQGRHSQIGYPSRERHERTHSPTLSPLLSPASSNDDTWAAESQQSVVSSEDSEGLHKVRTSEQKSWGKWAILWDQSRGMVLMILSQFFSAMMATVARLLETTASDGEPMQPFQMIFVRQSITTIASLIYMWWARVPDAPWGPREVRPLLIARGLGGFFGDSLLWLPVGESTVLTFLAPMLAAFVLSLVVGTPFTRSQKLAGLVAMVGVVIIAQPLAFIPSLSHTDSTTPNLHPGNHVARRDVLNDNQTTTIDTDSATVTHGSTQTLDLPEATPAQRAIAIGMSLIGVCGAASAFVTISWIGKRAHSLITVNYYSAWSMIVSGFALLFIPGVDFRWPASGREWILMAFFGSAGFIMQLLLTAAINHRRSNRVLNLFYSQMLFALVDDLLIFGVIPSTASLIGSALILVSCLWSALAKDPSPAAESHALSSGNETSVSGASPSLRLDGSQNRNAQRMSEESIGLMTAPEMTQLAQQTTDHNSGRRSFELQAWEDRNPGKEAV